MVLKAKERTNITSPKGVINSVERPTPSLSPPRKAITPTDYNKVTVNRFTEKLRARTPSPDLYQP